METRETPLPPARERPFGEKVKEDAKGILGGLKEGIKKYPGIALLVGLGSLAGLEASSILDEPLEEAGIGEGHGLATLDEALMQDDEYIAELEAEGLIMRKGEEFNGETLETDVVVFDPEEPDAAVKELNTFNLFSHWLGETSWFGENVIDPIEDAFDEESAEPTEPVEPAEPAEPAEVATTRFSNFTFAEFLEEYQSHLDSGGALTGSNNLVTELQNEMSRRIPDEFEGQEANLREMWDQINSLERDLSRAPTPEAQAQIDLYKLYLEDALGPEPGQLESIRQLETELADLQTELDAMGDPQDDVEAWAYGNLQSQIQGKQDELDAIFNPATGE
ncbi:hypothetical protein GF362_01545 [Candidatus Dojkabacteria bacterium]|nr:hypothetical protein [Candidatus Dojkabacteria bacterium]